MVYEKGKIPKIWPFQPLGNVKILCNASEELCIKTARDVSKLKYNIDMLLVKNDNFKADIIVQEDGKVLCMNKDFCHLISQN